MAFTIRTLLLVTTYLTNGNELSILSILLGFLLAIISRRQFIDLKNLTGSIKVKELTRHGSFNALGYGVGSALAGLILNLHTYAFTLITLAIFFAYLTYPNFNYSLNTHSGGLSKRDVAVAILFTSAITPLGNAVVLLAISKLYGDKFSGLGVLAYTLGSVLSHQIARFLRVRRYPIAKSIWMSSIIFVPILFTGNILILLASRFLTGAFLYAAQGLMEERTHKNVDSGKGLDFLWSTFSIVAFLLLLVLPKAGEHFGYFILPIISFSLGILISLLRKVMS
jgi:hypothetical protein